MKKQLKFLFLFAALMSVEVTKVHAYDAEIDGILYSFNGNEAEVVRRSGNGMTPYNGDITIPAEVTYNGKNYHVTAIGEKAFAYVDANITLPEGIKTIGIDAFQGCKLVSLNIPSTVQLIKKGAFGFLNQKTDENGNVLNKYPKLIVKSLEAWMKIEHESALLESEIRLDQAETLYPGWRLFTDENTEITDLVVPEGIDSIRAYAFSGCRSLKSITMSDRVKSIGMYAFYRCTSLNSAAVGDGVTFVGDYAFSISDYNNSSGYSGFVDYEKGKYKDIPIYGLRYLSLGKSVKSIGANAFECNQLTQLTLPESLEIIGDRAFYRCRKLLSLVIPNKVTTIGNYAFYSDSHSYRDELQSLVIGSGVLSIDYWAFGYPVKTIWLTNTPPNGYNSTGNGKGQINYVSNNLYKFDNDVDVRVYPLLSSMFSVDGIKYVPTSMSDRTCDAIDAVYDESAELTKIGTSATYRGVTMRVNNVLPWTCCGNSYIKNVELTDLPFIDDHVFDGCSNLGSVKLPETVTYLGECSFRGCSSLREFTIPAATTNIKFNAFDDCSALQNVNMADGPSALNLAYNAQIEEYGKVKLKLYLKEATPLFEDCPLDYVYIGRNIQYGITEKEGYSPFYRNTSLRSVRITDTETEISENEFYGCTGLKNVWIGNGVTAINKWAFSDCSSLDYFEFGSAMNYIGQEAFSDCANVRKIISHAVTPPVCGLQALDDINKWTCTLYVPDASVVAYQKANQWKEFLFTADVKPITVKADEDAPVHSLSGQRLTAPRKGINIVGGKKIVVR